MAGRPSIYSQELGDEICRRVVEGESMRSICRDEHLPGRMTVLGWLKHNADFRASIEIARQLQQDTLVEETLELANSATPENWQVKKLQIWARQWHASKLAPKKYGDRQSLDVDLRHSFSELTDSELASELARLTAQTALLMPPKGET